MPELPEVETIVRRLALRLEGREVVGVEVKLAKSWQGEVEKVVGVKVEKVGRRAKMIVISLARRQEGSKTIKSKKPTSLVSKSVSNEGVDSWYLLIHLKMTGQLIHVASNNDRLGGGHPTADWVADLPGKHTRVIIRLNDGSTLYFNDQRTFGWIKVVDEVQLKKEVDKYGPDINDPTFSLENFVNSLKNRTMSIKQAIMSNQLMSGVGNIYACDGLHLAGLSPTRPAGKLTKSQYQKLYLALREVIEMGIKLGGATISDYTDVDGFAGQYQTVCRVYGRAGQPCAVCQTKIVRIKQGGRSTFYCPKCQK